MTDLEGWRLVVGNDSYGQHQWVYLFPEDPQREAWKQSKEDKYWLGLDTVLRIISFIVSSCLTLVPAIPERSGFAGCKDSF